MRLSPRIACCGPGCQLAPSRLMPLLSLLPCQLMCPLLSSLGLRAASVLGESHAKAHLAEGGRQAPVPGSAHACCALAAWALMELYLALHMHVYCSDTLTQCTRSTDCGTAWDVLSSWTFCPQLAGSWWMGSSSDSQA